MVGACKVELFMLNGQRGVGAGAFPEGSVGQDPCRDFLNKLGIVLQALASNLVLYPSQQFYEQAHILLFT